MQGRWTSNWDVDPDLTGLRAVLDPADELGVKNAFIHACHERGLRRALRGTGAAHPFAIDFGCGVGRFTPLLLDFAEHVVGVDVHPRYLERARAEHGGPRTTFTTLEDAPRLEGPGLAFCVGVLAHLDEDDAVAALAELRARVGPGGSLVLAERTVAPGARGGGDIAERPPAWYEAALREAGWRPVGARMLRRSRSLPARAVSSVAPRLPSPLRGMAAGGLALVETGIAGRRAPSGASESCFVGRAA